MASAGFDRTIRLWEGTYPYSQVACLEGHRQLVSDLCWAQDGQSLVSASFDQASCVAGKQEDMLSSSKLAAAQQVEGRTV